MANTNVKLHGKDAAIYLGGTFVSASSLPTDGIKVASKTEWTLQRNRDYVDATVFGDTNKTYLAGLPNVQGTFAGMLDVSGDLLLNAATSAAQQIYLFADDGTNGGTIRMVAHGLGFIDASINATNTDAIRYTGEFRAAAAWTIDNGG
jgi:hypothetical protein